MPYTERVSARRKSRVRKFTAHFRPGLRAGKERYLRSPTGRGAAKPDFDREGTEPGYGYLWLRMAKPYAGETLAGIRRSLTEPKWRLRTATVILTCRTSRMRCTTPNIPTVNRHLAPSCAPRRTTSCEWKTGVVRNTSNSPRSTERRN